MNQKIKEILKAEDLSWEKFAEITGNRNRSNAKVKIEGWANKLNEAFELIGYEVIIRKKSAEQSTAKPEE